ncbi:hypothetical protein BDP27DRAFT_1357264 [Rhodocollybia butyracea]|uniref:VWFA domain-containing protein n=1 Tax=Rhodocollybia butyracea TaxID=206335 RepID=A0A9P5Q2E4_9AGAR|nr:hypothetical protein BDP27DRAFT_1357264 [Rhodocollybia butyracea]
MLPSKADVDDFIAVVPYANEKTASMFLEGANNIDEAIGQYFENPDRYSYTKEDTKDSKEDTKDSKATKLQVYSPPPYAPPTTSRGPHRPHTNAVIEAGHRRARDENLQRAHGVYNSDIEPEHETEYYCSCDIHQYKRRKIGRLRVQEAWSKAVMYPGEKFYHDCYQNTLFGNNPYRYRVVSPYGNYSSWYNQRPSPRYYTMAVQQTIQLNAALNAEAQAAIDAKEPAFDIWAVDELGTSISNMSFSDSPSYQVDDKKGPVEKGSTSKRHSIAGPPTANNPESSKLSRFASLKRAVVSKVTPKSAADRTHELRSAILDEENGRWPDQEWRQIVEAYQEKLGISKKVAYLRHRQPIQYLHLLRAGYFEPIPVAWANLNSNPLKFSIEAAAGWRGITPAWRGYEDTAEERLYWILNHREGSVGMRMKPDIISEMNMARARMATAVEPAPAYYALDDTCHLQHTSDGYSKQVMPPPFRAYDRPEVSTDDTMILLDVSGSMDFDPVRPNYNQYLITDYSRSTQPKNKHVAKAIIRRFTDAMSNHDHNFQGYQLTTFSSEANYIGVINHANLNSMWSNIRIGGGTRVMTGWQKVKDLHFQKHSESATHHPVYGWQAGPKTPMLRLLLLLDGEATDMDEFELDLLGLSWVHVTIFLIGVDGCPHHHRHANELQRISEVNHHVSFVDAQGNTPERFVTHELLKRHLGYDVSMAEFEELEQLPAYAP